jgi:hypothetical protein
MMLNTYLLLSGRETTYLRRYDENSQSLLVRLSTCSSAGTSRCTEPARVKTQSLMLGVDLYWHQALDSWLDRAQPQARGGQRCLLPPPPGAWV